MRSGDHNLRKRSYKLRLAGGLIGAGSFIHELSEQWGKANEGLKPGENLHDPKFDNEPSPEYKRNHDFAHKMEGWVQGSRFIIEKNNYCLYKNSNGTYTSVYFHYYSKGNLKMNKETTK